MPIDQSNENNSTSEPVTGKDDSADSGEPADKDHASGPSPATGTEHEIEIGNPPNDIVISTDDVALGSLDFEPLTPTDFEEFCFDLMSAVGFINVDWRKGTPLPSSPSDSGRDIVGLREHYDVDGHKYTETWFVDCKHYKRGVPPDALQGTLAWAQAERPAVVLFIASGYLTNGAKDWLATYMRENRPAFRIRVWEKPQLRSMVEQHLDVAFKHDVATATLRRISEILAAEAALVDQLWYGRKPLDENMSLQGWSQETISAVLRSKRQMEEQYGREVLDENVEDDWHWGYLSGRVAALRWVLGWDWGMLDS
ncbi:restriction endonuclease [Arthrobacter celericrescens]|uniref:restriction endonuclease n=1 Tax=Arthrobacter celericrescens TaxID=2320851 RepID=UPI0013C478F2|nr:restriction endonuclease [Arthrobacter celericrescens]